MKNKMTKMIISTITISLTVFLILGFFGGIVSQKRVPDNLGLKDGKLAVCPSSKNCVSSQSPVTDTLNYVQPWTYQTTDEQAWVQLMNVIQAAEGSQVITAENDYIHAEFSSNFFGFIDDVEIYRDTAKRIIHIRSSSRIGRDDLGANRERIEQLRLDFESGLSVLK